jgi:iron uptake system component EfeO
MSLSVKSIARGLLATGLLSLALAACGDNTATVPAAATTAPAAATTNTATTTSAAATTGAAGTTSAAETGQATAKGVQALNDLGKNLDATSAALQKNDLAAAKAAYKKFDEGWVDVEGYVQQFNRKFYQAIEDAMTPVGRELLRNTSTTVATVTPLLKTLSDTYSDAVKQMSAAAPAGSGSGNATTTTAAAISGPDVEAATTKVDQYLKGESDKLVTNTQAFVAAVKSKDIAKAKAAYQQARFNYEGVEFLAETFKDLDVAIDARPDDFPQGENDPTWTGFHPLEKAIWAEGKLDANTDKLADKLMADVTKLHDEIKTMPIDPAGAIAGAADLIEEIQSGKITGEEERYGHTDFNDFKANLASAKFVYQAYAPFVKQRNADLDGDITAAFSEIETALVPYFSADGTASDYSKLNDTARKALAQKVEALADSFSKVNGTLGLNA